MSRHGEYFLKARVDEYGLEVELRARAAEIRGHWGDFIEAQQDQEAVVYAEETASKIFEVLTRGCTGFRKKSLDYWLLPFSSGLTDQEVTTLLHTVLFGGLLGCFHAKKSLLGVLFVRQQPGELNQVDLALRIQSRKLVQGCLYVTFNLLTKKIPLNKEVLQEVFAAQVDRVPSISFLLLLFLSHLDLPCFESIYNAVSPVFEYLDLNLPGLFSTQPVTPRLLREAGFPVAADDAVVVPHRSFLEFWVVACSLAVARQEASLPDWCATDRWSLAMAAAVTPSVAEYFVDRLLGDENFASLYHKADDDHKHALLALLHSKVSPQLQKQLMMHCAVYHRGMLGARVRDLLVGAFNPDGSVRPMCFTVGGEEVVASCLVDMVTSKSACWEPKDSMHAPMMYDCFMLPSAATNSVALNSEYLAAQLGMALRILRRMDLAGVGVTYQVVYNLLTKVRPAERMSIEKYLKGCVDGPFNIYFGSEETKGLARELLAWLEGCRRFLAMMPILRLCHALGWRNRHKRPKALGPVNPEETHLAQFDNALAVAKVNRAAGRVHDRPSRALLVHGVLAQMARQPDSQRLEIVSPKLRNVLKFL